MKNDLMIRMLQSLSIFFLSDDATDTPFDYVSKKRLSDDWHQNVESDLNEKETELQAVFSFPFKSDSM